jgi:hypothetical protein
LSAKREQTLRTRDAGFTRTLAAPSFTNFFTLKDFARASRSM